MNSAQRYILSKAQDGSYMIRDTSIADFFDSQKYHGISDPKKARQILVKLNSQS
jgi:hypothetical protein